MKPPAAIVIFTYKEDAPSLRRCVEFLNHNLHECPIYVFDDASNPIPFDDEALRAVDGYKRTTFDRRGNLNGRECVMGELACFLHAAAHSGAEMIIKIDPDTAVLSRQILTCSAPLTGTAWLNRFVAGSCYVLSVEFLQQLIIATATTGRLLPEEDAALTILMREIGAEVDLRESPDFATSFDYRNPSITVHRYNQSLVVTFGRREWIDAPESARRIVVAGAMSAFFAASYEGAAVHPCEVATNADSLLKWMERRGLASARSPG